MIEAHSTNWLKLSKPTTMSVLKKSRSTGVVPLLETSPLQGSTRLTKLNLQNLLLKPKQNCFSNGNKGISKKLFFCFYSITDSLGIHLHQRLCFRLPLLLCSTSLAGIIIKISRTAAFPTKILEFLSHRCICS